jgi:hypothetical protein
VLVFRPVAAARAARKRSHAAGGWLVSTSTALSRSIAQLKIVIVATACPLGERGERWAARPHVRSVHHPKASSGRPARAPTARVAAARSAR